MKRYFSAALLFIFLFQAAASAQNNPALLDSLLKANSSLFPEVAQNPSKYQVQILYTQVDRNRKNRPHFTTYKYNVNKNNYFYPASSVKIAGAVLSLQKLNELNIKGLDKYTRLRIDSAYSGQTRVLLDLSSKDSLPSIAHYVKKIFLASDNDAFNRTYEFLGQKYLNEELWKRGLKDVKLQHRVSVALSNEENRHTNPFTFYDGDKIFYHQEAQVNPVEYRNDLPTLSRGNGYIDGNGKLVNEPKDFTYNNYISVESLQGILKRIIFPESFPKEERFNLTGDDYKFLYKYMSMLARESDYPKYDPKEYPDANVKFLMYGGIKDTIPSNIRIFNKIGLAYGYLTDNAYIVDFDKKVEFFVTAVIYVNNDEIFNDDKYEYDQTGLPFLKNLGKVIYNYELSRPRKHKPDLSIFKN
ncbi:MAG TPA: serine hydrolase [Ignavibacteriales bacterium]|nr:serine hydrolase [Ignavibacteriales bacterium]